MVGITTLRWDPLATGNTLLRQIFYQLQYVDATLNGCTSTSRIAVAAIITPKPTKVTTSKLSVLVNLILGLPTERLILLVEYIWLAMTYVLQTKN
jgi:hypothetical protein